jgi:Transposase IS66 family
MRSTKLFCDETRCPVLDPGRGKTKTGYLWAVARDDRPWGGSDPPAVAYHYAPGRGGEHARTMFAGFNGVLQVDGYDGYNGLADPVRTGGPVTLEPLPTPFLRPRERWQRADRIGGTRQDRGALRHRSGGPLPKRRHATRRSTGTHEATRRCAEDMAWRAARQTARSSETAEAIRYGTNQWNSAPSGFR